MMMVRVYYVYLAIAIYKVYNKYIKKLEELTEMKKTETLTFKTHERTKEKLLKICEEKEWSISQVCDKALKEYIERELEKDS